MNYAIINFWNLQEKSEGAYDAIYQAMMGDAYPRKDVNEAFEEQGPSPDMSDYTYHPVISETEAKYIENLFKVKLQRATVKARPEVGPKIYELTHISPHLEL